MRNLAIMGRVAEMFDRRKELRSFADEEVILLVGGEAKPELARVTDRSAGGMRITHKVHLDEGAVIHVLTPASNTRVRVMWTSEEGGMFISGLQITKG